VKVYRLRLYLVHGEERSAQTFWVDGEEYLLYQLLDQGCELPRACEQGWCLACAAKLLSGKVEMEAYLYYPQDIEAGFILLCSAKARSDLEVELDPHQTRRQMIQHRLDHNLLVRTYPRLGFRRGRAKKEGLPKP